MKIPKNVLAEKEYHFFFLEKFFWLRENQVLVVFTINIHTV